MNTKATINSDTSNFVAPQDRENNGTSLKMRSGQVPVTAAEPPVQLPRLADPNLQLMSIDQQQINNVMITFGGILQTLGLSGCEVTLELETERDNSDE